MRDVSSGARGRLSFGAQHVHTDAGGSFTGEISIPQVKDAKATHVLVGHAERRAMGETNEDVQKKIDAVFGAQLTPILCIGEKSRTGFDYFAEVREQLRACIPENIGKKLSRIVIAYEPVWAIGAPVAMRPHDMHEMAIFIRKMLVEKFGTIGHAVTILYGGSVDTTNAVDMLKNGDVAGLLVGRASVDVHAFTALVRTVSEA
jgi:triosephosphate isomerase (TIM)